MTDDEFKPLDLSAFLQNSQLLRPTFKENYSDFLRQLLEKAIEVWDNNPKLAYSYCEEFKQHIPESVFPDLLRLVDKAYEDRNLKDYLELEKKTVRKSEKICIHTLKACFHYQRLDIDECADECRVVLNLDSDNEHANYLLALCLAIRQKHKEAITYYKKVLNSKDYHDSTTANLAYSYLFLRKNLKALRLNKQIVDKLSDNYRVQYYMALCYSRLWRYKKALYYLNRAESLEKNFSGTYLTRGGIHFRLRNFDKAYKDLQRAKELGSVNADNLLKRL